MFTLTGTYLGTQRQQFKLRRLRNSRSAKVDLIADRRVKEATTTESSLGKKMNGIEMPFI